MFATNHWYVAAWDYEVGVKPLARTICGEPLVLYRTLDGRAVALHDACPHRLLPLSMGLREGDSIRCRYHGMVFDSAGRCTKPPTQETIPARFAVKKAYEVMERHRFVWVWIGEGAPDPALLPDLWPCSTSGWRFDGGVIHVKADYRLMIDNLMDLSHETYVHPESIGQQEILESPIEMRNVGDRVFVSRWMLGIDAPPFWRNALKRPGPVDRWQICQFLLPSAVMIDVGVAEAGTGAPEGDRSHGVNGYVIDFMSPESDDSHWYFWGMARNFDIEDDGFTARFRAQQSDVFLQDIEVIEAQQKSISSNQDMKLRVFNIDAGGARSRQLIESSIKKQAG